MELGLFDGIGAGRRRRPTRWRGRSTPARAHLRPLLDSLVAAGPARPGRRPLRAERDGRALPHDRRRRLDGRPRRAWRPDRSPTGSGSPTPCATGAWPRRSRTTPPPSTARSSRRRSRPSAACRVHRPGDRVRPLDGDAARARPGRRRRRRGRSVVLEAHPGATAVVNDLAGVIDLAAAQLAELGLAERCELRPGDFHAIPVEDGGHDVVVLGHVCRTEGVDGARHLIGRAHRALRPGGRLLLADYFADPEPTRNPFGALMGTTMVANTPARVHVHQRPVRRVAARGRVRGRAPPRADRLQLRVRRHPSPLRRTPCPSPSTPS